MELPYTGQLLVDAMKVAVNSCGVDLSDEQLVKFITVLDRRYRAMLPKEEPAVRNVDLEDAIREIKNEKK